MHRSRRKEVIQGRGHFEGNNVLRLETDEGQNFIHYKKIYAHRICTPSQLQSLDYLTHCHVCNFHCDWPDLEQGKILEDCGDLLDSGDMDEAAELADQGPGPEAQLIAKSEAGRIAGCLGQLDPDKADAVRRAYMEGDTYAELAARYAQPLNTIRTWLRRSLLKLKECLSS